MSELRGFVYKCDCIKPMIESIVEKLMPLEEVTEAYLDPVSLSGITGTSLEYKTANKKKSRRFVLFAAKDCWMRLSNERIYKRNDWQLPQMDKRLNGRFG